MGIVDEEDIQLNLQRCKIESAPHGKVPVFMDGRYRWVDVIVLGFEDSKYKVQLMSNDKIKLVGQLSIKFRWQDDDVQRKRLDNCR